MRMLPSGTQHEIIRGDQRAVVAEVGATLRLYRVGDRDIVTTFEENATPVGCQGQHLLPWPNRIRDGRYTFDGIDHQLPINEVERGNAIHGLASWHVWGLADLFPNSVTCRTVIHPQPGWPGTLLATITHTLTDNGLVVEVSATNVGETPCPFGYAAHPYLTASGGLDDAVVELPFARCVESDERLLPVRGIDVAGTAADVNGHRLGSTRLDTPYTAPRRDTDGRWRVRLQSGSSATALWGDEHFDWLQVYTPPDRTSLAVEPSTCGPDAFNEGPTHDSMLTLASGECFRAAWGIEPR